MKVKISRSELIREFPDLRLYFLQREDERYEFEAAVINETSSQFEKFDFLTKREIQLLSKLPKQGYMHSRGIENSLYMSENNVCVTIKNIRQKFKAHKVPIEIINIRTRGYQLR